MGCRPQMKPRLSAWENGEMLRVGSGDVAHPAGLLGAFCGQVAQMAEEASSGRGVVGAW